MRGCIPLVRQTGAFGLVGRGGEKERPSAGRRRSRSRARLGFSNLARSRWWNCTSNLAVLLSGCGGAMSGMGLGRVETFMAGGRRVSPLREPGYRPGALRFQRNSRDEGGLIARVPCIHACSNPSAISCQHVGGCPNRVTPPDGSELPTAWHRQPIAKSKTMLGIPSAESPLLRNRPPQVTMWR